MTRIFVSGAGAVSPAGWGLGPFWDALQAGVPLPENAAEGDHARASLRHRRVPSPPPRAPYSAHPRLRRASAITQQAMAAAWEALGPEADAIRAGNLRLGIVSCVMTGGVTYSRRFFTEVLRDPATASPLLFPETVFNAPASHVAAVLGSPAANQTLVGDPSTFLHAIALGALWLDAGAVDRVLVLAAEETDWLTSEALATWHPEAIGSGGAGALVLRSSPVTSVELVEVTESIPYRDLQGRRSALQQVADTIGRPAGGAWWIDSRVGVRRLDDAESMLWKGWTGTRWSPKSILGEGLACGSAWQCVAATEAVRRGLAPAAVVTVAGINLAAAAARWRCPASP